MGLALKQQFTKKAHFRKKIKNADLMLESGVLALGLL